MMPNVALSPSPAHASRSPRLAWWRALRTLNVGRVQALLDTGVDPCLPHSDGHTALGWLATAPIPMHRLDEAADLAERLIAAGANPGRPEPNGHDAPVIQVLRPEHQRLHATMGRTLVRRTAWSRDPADPLATRAMSLTVTARALSNLTSDLLAAGVSPNVTWKSFVNASKARSALAWSLLHGEPSTTAALLNAGATLSVAEGARHDDPYLMALKTAILPGEIRADQDLRRRLHVTSLLDRNVPMNGAARQRAIPLAVTHAYLDVPLLDRLHAQGAAWDGTLRDGQTALHVVMSRPVSDGNSAALIDHLLAQGLDPGAPDSKGDTPIERLRRQAARQPSLLPLLAQTEGRVLAQAMATPGHAPDEPRVTRARL